MCHMMRFGGIILPIKLIIENIMDRGRVERNVDPYGTIFSTHTTAKPDCDYRTYSSKQTRHVDPPSTALGQQYT